MLASIQQSSMILSRLQIYLKVANEMSCYHLMRWRYRRTWFTIYTLENSGVSATHHLKILMSWHHTSEVWAWILWYQGYVGIPNHGQVLAYSMHPERYIWPACDRCCFWWGIFLLIILQNACHLSRSESEVVYRAENIFNSGRYIWFFADAPTRWRLLWNNGK